MILGYLKRSHAFCLPNSLSYKGLKIFFGRNLTQESTVVTGKDAISMPGIPKTKKER